MNTSYLRQVELVMRSLPAIAEEPCFALKGGTAINLFEINLPRLSVDIDLTYTIISGRAESILGINTALKRIAERLQDLHFTITVRGTDASCKILCQTPNATIKIEPNYILRGTIFPTRILPSCEAINGLTKMESVMPVLSFPELYGGKFCAALDRQHPRDLFDVAQFYKKHEFNEAKYGFLALALGHNRPLHELLNPILQNHRDVFTQQFAGMSDAPFTYEEHEATFAHLRKDILASLTDADRQNLLDFVSLAETMPDFCIPELMSLPAILWKRHNLEVLRKNDPHKFSDQHNQLARIFE